MRRLGGFLLGAVIVAFGAYFAYAAVEGSHRMVDRYGRNTDCRTPAQLDPPLAYDAINYDVATDAQMAAREADMTDCSAQGAAPGDALVSSDGVRLAGWWVPAASGIGEDGPTVVLAHGWTDNKSGILEALPVFHDTWNAVLFDFRNHGQSPDSPTTQGILEQRDLVAVLDWLEAEKGPDTVVVWGQSMGGHAAVNVAATDPRIDALILDSEHPRLAVPFANRAEAMGYPLGPMIAVAGMVGGWVRTGVNVWSAEPVDAIGDLGERPVLIAHGGRDEGIPLEDAQQLHQAALDAGVDARFEVCSEAGHAGVIETCPDDYRAWVDSFLAGIGG